MNNVKTFDVKDSLLGTIKTADNMRSNRFIGCTLKCLQYEKV